MNVLYHLPNLKSNGFVAKLVNGWWLGNIVSAQTGYGFTPVLGTSRSNSLVLGNGNDRVNLGTDIVTPATGKAAGVTFVPYDPHTVITGDPNHWYNPLMFRLAPVGTLGNASRGMLRGPGLATWNVSINKDMSMPFLSESAKLQFRAEIFNILNRANFATPNLASGTVFQGSTSDIGATSELPTTGTTANPLGTAGQITSTATTSRQIQLALKVIF